MNGTGWRNENSRHRPPQRPRMDLPLFPSRRKPKPAFVDEHKSLLATVTELSSVEIARLLIERGEARVKGSGAIVRATEKGRLDIFELLLKKGADVNEVEIEHSTNSRLHKNVRGALHRAV